MSRLPLQIPEGKWDRRAAGPYQVGLGSLAPP